MRAGGQGHREAVAGDPGAVRREVFARDGGSCAWIGEDGRRCGSTWQLEHDHVESAARGGGATVEEIRLLCRRHNMLHAEQVFGREYMARFRRGEALAMSHSPATCPAPDVPDHAPSP